jgi:CBS domain containing-hemolysin-like protein|tara:strand:+ start:357 stop:1733 length:1377 start_codon:yes stop_codon:yes gene_type:complete
MIETLLTLLFGILIILAIIAANGYFVAQEFAYMAVDRTRLAASAASGDDSAKRALEVTNRTSFMLSGAQLGITVTGLMVGYVAEPLVGESLGVLLQGTGMSVETGIAIGTVSALVVATVVQMVAGELYPKNLAIANPQPLSRALARSTLLYMSVFGWIISFFDKSANLLLRAVRIEPVHDLDVSASEDDLPHIIANSRDSGDLPVELSLMMDRILDFPQRDVEHAMVPRSQVDWVEPDTTLEELRGLMAQAHTRYPVIDDDDAPVGVVHLADVLARMDAGQTDDTVASVMRPATVLPTLMRLPDALEQLVTSTSQLACVIDEYGGFAGVLTIEDLAMEIVGEITDEHDVVTGEAVVSEGDNTWLMEGDVHLDEVERAIGYDLPRGDVETIAGMLIAELGALPSEGDTVSVDLPVDPSELVSEKPVRRRLEVTVLRIERHVPTEVRVKLVEVPITEDDQ